MSTSLSIRFDAQLTERLRLRTQATPGTSLSVLAQRLIEEGLRMADHPGVVFKDGPSGRRAALAFGPDVWEVIKLLRELDERGKPAVAAAAELLTFSEARVWVAMQYYAAYPEEIDSKIEEADHVSAEAKRAWDIGRQTRA